MTIEPIVLEGERVRLEPLTLDHLPALCEVGLDPEIWRLSLGMIRTPEELRTYVEAALRERDEGRSLPFATVERASGRVVGSTRYGNIDMPNRRVEIGWTWVAPPWQRTGVNVEAKYLMLRHAFETLGCYRVELKTDRVNERSRRAILALGAREEGILRSHMIVVGGRRRDSVYYSILDDEWPAAKHRLEERMARASGKAPAGGAAASGAGGTGEPAGGTA